MVITPVRVQGPGAAEEIERAIDLFALYRRVDLLIVGRGGGSAEDLACFNEERVVREEKETSVQGMSAKHREELERLRSEETKCRF